MNRLDEINRREFVDITGKTVIAASCCLLCREAVAVADETSEKPAFKLVAPCGIYCGACDKLVRAVHGQEPMSKHCHGCLSDRVPDWSCNKCDIRKCALEKEVESCGVCKSYPCNRLKAFQERHSFARELGKELEVIASEGLETWRKEKKAKWTCKKCKSPFSKKDKKCRKCGNPVNRNGMRSVSNQ